MSSYRVDVNQIRALANGHWDSVFAVLAPMLHQAMEHPGKHYPCPVHGGQDGFRLYKDYRNNGACVCNTCGKQRDGFATLCWVNGWNFHTALERVAQVLNALPDEEYEVIESHDIGTRIVGIIGFAGYTVRHPYGTKAYTVLLETNGSSQTLYGADLRRALETAGAAQGDRVEITQLTRQVLKNRNGRQMQRILWCARRLPSEAEEAKMLEQKHKKNVLLAAAIEDGWNRALPFSWKDPKTAPMANYLRRRALAVRDPALVSDLRFSPSETYRDENGNRTEHPAMIAAVRDANGTLVTIHRTFLTEDGRKAAVDKPKKLCALPDGVTVNGAAIRFGKAGTVLCFAEGIETALSVAIATGLPCWSCVSAGGLERVTVPRCVKTVFIFADKDRSGTGQKVALALQRRLQNDGILSCILLPQDDISEHSKGVDWNDVLREQSAKGFPIASLAGVCHEA